MADRNAAPTALGGDAVEEIAINLRRLLADVFTLLCEDEEFSLSH